MATRSSAIYFPLRSNASSLIAGPGVAAVRRRLMLGLLLHDEVILEAGYFRANAGPRGGLSLWSPEPLPGREGKWQHPRRRGKAVGGTFHWGVRRGDAPAEAPFRAMVVSPTSIAWEATFAPFLDEIPKRLRKVIGFGHQDDAYETSRIVGEWDRAAARDQHLLRHWPEKFIRDLYVGGLHRDLAMAGRFGMAMSADPAHAPVVAARIRAGQATAVAGQYALELVVPKGITWADVADLRRSRRLKDYRAVLREVEAAALAGATSTGDLEGLLGVEYGKRVGAAAEHHPGLFARVALAGFGLVVGAAGDAAAPGVGSIAGGAVGFAAGELFDQVTRPRWLAVHTRIHRAHAG